MKQQANKKIISRVCLISVVMLIACTEPSQIEGKWVIDLPPMIAQAKALHATDRQINQIQETFINGELQIKADQIRLSVPESDQDVSYRYRILSRQGGCYRLEIEMKEHEYCVTGNKMQIKDPDAMITIRYTKS